MGALMPGDVPISRADRIRTAADSARKTTGSKHPRIITTAQAQDLLKLYAQLPDAIVAAREALKVANEQSTGIALERYRELDARVAAIIGGSNAILG
jgi:hypothetical protein